MHKIHVSIIVTMSIFFSSAISAQESETGSQVDRSTFKSFLQGSSDIPDGITFHVAILSMVALADDDPEFATGVIQEEMRLDLGRSEELLSLFRETIKQIAADTARLKEEIGCITGVPRVYGQDTFTVFEQMDDIDELVASSYFLRAKNQVGQETGQELQSWVSRQKLNTVYAKYDHSKVSERSGAGGYERLERICRTLYANSSAENKQ
jgi:hypothetical protein